MYNEYNKGELLLKKICPNCEREYNSLDVVKCDNCGFEVYHYLTEDKGFGKVKSIFSSNKDVENKLINDLESLFKWENFFKNMGNSYGKEFFVDAKDFKDSYDDYDFPETIIIENDRYKEFLKNYYDGIQFIFKLDRFLSRIKSYNLTVDNIFSNLNDETVDEDYKIEYVKYVDSKLDNILKYKCFNFLGEYDSSFNNVINECDNVQILFRDVYRELDDIKDLKQYFNDFRRYFSHFSKKPSNHDEFKKKITSFKYLDIIPYFSPEDKELINQVKDIKTTFNEIDFESEKVIVLNSKIPNFYKEFDSLINGIVDDFTKHKFLDSYSDFKKDLFSFKYLKLLNNTDDIKKTIKFFDNFDDQWMKLVNKKNHLDKKESFKKDWVSFNEKWDGVIDIDSGINLEFFKQLSSFNNDLTDFKEEYCEFIGKNQFSSYKHILDYIDDINSKINDLDFDNFKVSILLNYLNDSSVNSNSKIERLNSYKEVLTIIDLDYLKSLQVFDSSLEIPYDDIKEIDNFFENVYSEISEVNKLKPIVDDYNKELKLPEDVESFENKISSFKYLDIIPYFDSSLAQYIKTLLELKNAFKQVDIEINKINSLILECSRCKLEFERVNNGKISKDDFLNKYSHLKEDVFSFKYLDLLPAFDSNLKDFVTVILEVQEIFNNI